MDKLLACAMAYEHLLDTRYRFVIGRKGKIIELEISFDSSQFHHLTGLHKLRDLRIFRGDRSKIYQQIRSGNIPFDFLKKSRYFSSIQGRLEAFPHIETFFDNDSTNFQNLISTTQKDKPFIRCSKKKKQTKIPVSAPFYIIG